MVPTDSSDAAWAGTTTHTAGAQQTALTLLLIRHGETASNAEGRIQGHQDVPLSPVGRAQAARLAVRLSQVWDGWGGFPAFPVPPPSAIFTSDLSRAAETAQILRGQLTALSRVPYFETPLLRERGFGEWEGLNSAEIQERFPGVDHPPGGETWTEVEDRTGQAFAFIQENLPPSNRETRQPAVSIMVVGHGGSLRLFLTRALGLGPDFVHFFRLGNTSLSAVTFGGQGGGPNGQTQDKDRIVLLNDAAHLEKMPSSLRG
ncbi:MAG: histidine phosphatase family protein [Cytophagales bacterium]|nr:histidine phosphatase family protein [Armatimonadota bacterium]